MVPLWFLARSSLSRPFPLSKEGSGFFPLRVVELEATALFDRMPNVFHPVFLAVLANSIPSPGDPALYNHELSSLHVVP